MGYKVTIHGKEIRVNNQSLLEKVAQEHEPWKNVPLVKANTMKDHFKVSLCNY